MTNPLAEIMADGLPQCDFGVLSHGFLAHGRDYAFVIQDVLGPDPGTHRLTFTHVVALQYLTGLSDEGWKDSWSDEFLDYERSKDLEGYVWGTNWSNAFPGIIAGENDLLAQEWSTRIGKPMHTMRLETDRFAISIVFHTAFLEKLSSDVGILDQVIFPLG